MSKSTSNVVAFADPSVPKDPLTELIRQGAQQLLSQAVIKSKITPQAHLPPEHQSLSLVKSVWRRCVCQSFLGSAALLVSSVQSSRRYAAVSA